MEEDYYRQEQSGENEVLRTTPSWVESLTGLTPLDYTNYRRSSQEIYVPQNVYSNEDMGEDEAPQASRSMEDLMHQLTGGEYDDPNTPPIKTDAEMTRQPGQVGVQGIDELALDNVIVIQQLNEDYVDSPASVLSQLALSGVDPSVVSQLEEVLSKTQGLAHDDPTLVSSQQDQFEDQDNGTGAEDDGYFRRVFSFSGSGAGQEDLQPVPQEMAEGEELPAAGEAPPLPEPPEVGAAFSSPTPPADEGLRGEQNRKLAEGTAGNNSRHGSVPQDQGGPDSHTGRKDGRRNSGSSIRAAENETNAGPISGQIANTDFDFRAHDRAASSQPQSSSRVPGEVPTWNYQPQSSQPVMGEVPTSSYQPQSSELEVHTSRRSSMRSENTGRMSRRGSRIITWTDPTHHEYEHAEWLPGSGAVPPPGADPVADWLPLVGEESYFARPMTRRHSSFTDGTLQGREREYSVASIPPDAAASPWSTGSNLLPTQGPAQRSNCFRSLPLDSRGRSESMVTQISSVMSDDPLTSTLTMPPPDLSNTYSRLGVLPPQRRMSHFYRNKDQIGPNEHVWRPDDNLYREYKHQMVVEFKATFMKVNDIDTLSQQFESEIYIQAKWQEEALIGIGENELGQLMPEDLWDPHLIILNNTGDFDQERRSFVVRYEEGYEAPVVVLRWRFKGLFREPLELQHFPFDVQDLTIQVSTERSVDEIKMKHDQNHLSSVNTRAFQDSQEWMLYKHVECMHHTTSLEYASSTTHPILVFSCRVRRKVWYFIWNIVFIVFLVMVLSFLTISVDPTSSDRLANTMTLFLTMVAFKLVVKQSLPTISYLTYLDIYVLGSLVYLVVFAMENSVMCYLARWMDHELVEAYDHMMCLMLASVIITLHLILIIHIQVNAMKRHRLMCYNDQQYALQARELMKRLDTKMRKKNEKSVKPAAQRARSI